MVQHINEWHFKVPSFVGNTGRDLRYRRDKALTDLIRIRISYPKGQRIGFSFVIQIDVPKSEQIRIIAHRMLTRISEYPVVWDRGKAAIFFQIQQSACVLYFWQKAFEGVWNNVGFCFFPSFVLNAFSIFIFATALFQFGHFPLARFIWGVRIIIIFFYKYWFHFSHRLARNINPTKFFTFRGRQNVSFIILCKDVKLQVNEKKKNSLWEIE